MPLDHLVQAWQIGRAFGRAEVLRELGITGAAIVAAGTDAVVSRLDEHREKRRAVSREA